MTAAVIYYYYNLLLVHYHISLVTGTPTTRRIKKYPVEEDTIIATVIEYQVPVVVDLY